MKKILFLLISGIAMGSTVPVTGSGTFGLDNYFDTYANFCMVGQGISTCSQNVPIGPAPPVYLSQITKLDVSGVINITSYQEFGTRFVDGKLNTNWWGRGTFTIDCPTVSTPEPTAWSLVIIGILFLVILVWVKASGKF